ncbi:SDR family NAD(P)-dependent oxidoreductase [Streptomyces sp. NPDC002722]|uniref:SDR family oxidoreductase n=1 Tax=unclassified Streptomyces TaxID=2593676 RepID=UPI0033225FC2
MPVLAAESLGFGRGKVLRRGDRGGFVAVTGAGRGIGRSIAAALVRDGCHVAVCDVDGDALRGVAAELGRRCHAVVVDVSDAEAVHGFVAGAAACFGSLDLMVNNAGIMPSGLLGDHSVQMLQRVVEVNLLGTLYGCRSAIEVMSAQCQGHIVNIASATAVMPLAGLAPYSATKAAVLALGEALRGELRGTGIRLSTVCPYQTATAASAGLGVLRGFGPIHPDRVGAAVARLRCRPRPVVHVPGYLALLPLLGVLPGWARAVAGGMAGTDVIALGAAPAGRAEYMEEILRASSVLRFSAGADLAKEDPGGGDELPSE